MIVNQDWLNQNSGRAYPVAESMSRIPVDSNGVAIDALLPNRILLDFVISMPGQSNNRLYISKVVFTADIVTLILNEADTDVVVASITAAGSSHSTGDAYTVVGIGDYEDARGWAVIGDISASTDMPYGSYTFTSATATLEACCVRPILRGVRSITIENSGSSSEKIYGDIKLKAGENISLVYDSGDNAILIHAVNDSGYTEECECAAVPTSNIVRTINGIAVEDVLFAGDGECIEVTTVGNTITITDSCSKPCCGCPELDYINQNIKIIERSIDTLTEYSARLQERVSTFVTNFVLTS